MATAEGMSGVDLRAVTAETGRLLPLWVGKAYQREDGVLLIRLNGLEHARYTLLVEPGRRWYLTASPGETPKMPSSFAMLLRKHLTGGRVLSVLQPGLQRAVVVTVGKRDSELRLIAELFDEGNLVLTDGRGVVLHALRPHRYRERDVVAGAVYRLPGEDATLLPEGEFARWLHGQERDLVRALAVGCLLGGRYAEYVCAEAGQDRQVPAAEADAGAVYRALQALLSRAGEPGPVIAGKSCLPFSLGEAGEVSAGTESFSAALDAFFPPAAPARKEKEAKQKESQAERVRRQQEAAVRKFEERIRATERVVEAVYEHYPLVQETLQALQKASSTHSWQEIAAILKANREGVAKQVVGVDPAEAAVELDLGVSVRLFVHESIEQNLGRYYDRVKVLKRKIEGARAAMARPVPEKAVRKVTGGKVKKRWYHRFRWCMTSDNILMLCGRDAGQNEELVKRYLEGTDRFLHADVHGAAVVVLKGETAHLEEAAQFAASYSGAWKSGHFSADVYMVRPDQVSKTPEAGEYVSRGSFIVRGERTWFRGVPLGVAIGLVKEPVAAVIGGPVAAVAARAGLVVQLVPGPFSENDTAKKVLRSLRERLTPEEERGLRSVLNTEAVAAFVPAGGSDIAEGS